jgi:predicted nuclease with TOPRIM domain
METSIAQLQTESSELENTVLALNEKVNSLTREKVISESTTDLADTQVEKLKSLLEDIECTSETSFRKKVATIKEFYLNGAAVEETLVEENANESSYITTETVIENETIAEETVSPAMQKYLTALSRLNKANEATVPVR